MIISSNLPATSGPARHEQAAELARTPRIPQSIHYLIRSAVEEPIKSAPTEMGLTLVKHDLRPKWLERL